MKNVLTPLTPVPSLPRDDTAASAEREIGDVLAACIQSYDRFEAANATEACELAAGG